MSYLLYSILLILFGRRNEGYQIVSHFVNRSAFRRNRMKQEKYGTVSYPMLLFTMAPVGYFISFFKKYSGDLQQLHRSNKNI